MPSSTVLPQGRVVVGFNVVVDVAKVPANVVIFVRIAPLLCFLFFLCKAKAAQQLVYLLLLLHLFWMSNHLL